MRYRQRVDTNGTKYVGSCWSMRPPATTWTLSWDQYAVGGGYLRSPWRSGECCYDNLHSGPPFINGGPFNKWRFTDGGMDVVPLGSIEGSYPWYQPSNPIVRYRYVGGFLPNYQLENQYKLFSNPVYNWNGKWIIGPQSVDGSHTWGDASVYGATAWKRYRPGRPGADMGVFLGEAKEIPRMLMTTAKGFRDLYVSRYGRIPKKKVRKAADHWLNTQFGWLPFLSDLRAFYKTWKNADKMLSQIVRDNGQWIKRGGTVSSDEGNTEVLRTWTNCLSWPLLPEGLFVNDQVNAGDARLCRVTTRKTWFEARFRYYIPKIESVGWRTRATAELFGASVNPALLWELTPWSWLVDWFSNVGDVFSNMDTGLAQNLAAKYAYVMQTTLQRITFTSTLRLKAGMRTGTFVYDAERKHRAEANPFGFNLTWDGLSARQWSILGALGITRMH